MKNWIYIIILAFGIVACSEEAEQIPADVLDKPMFTDVMMDMQLIEAAYNRQLAQDEDSVAKGKVYHYYGEIFQKYNTDEATFNRSFEWYTSHPEHMVEVYEIVMERLATIAEE